MTGWAVYGVGYGACWLALGLLDAVWLGWVMRDFYAQAFGDAMVEKVRVVPAAIFYVVYPAGLVFLALVPRPGSMVEAVLRSAVLGLLTYGVYDMTNLATLKFWTVKLAVIDVAWGVVASAIGGAVAHAAMQWAARR